MTQFEFAESQGLYGSVLATIIAMVMRRYERKSSSHTISYVRASYFLKNPMQLRLILSRDRLNNITFPAKICTALSRLGKIITV